MKEGVSRGRDSIYNNFLSIPPTYYRSKRAFPVIRKMCTRTHLYFNDDTEDVTLKTRNINISLSTFINEVFFHFIYSI